MPAALILVLALLPIPLSAQAKPPIRALTAFVRIDAAHYESQIRDAVTLLRDAKHAYEQHEYEVQTIRITTQPFPEILKGLDDQQATQLLQSLNALATRVPQCIAERLLRDAMQMVACFPRQREWRRFLDVELDRYRAAGGRALSQRAQAVHQ